MSDRVCEQLSIAFPLLQAGMGGVSGPALAAAVANAGAGGIVALYKHRPEEVEALVQATRERTPCSFGVNLVPEVVEEAYLEKQVRAVLGLGVSPLFFTFFGLPSAPVCEMIRRAGSPLLIQVGTVQQAREAAALGADILILQGSEAGGHHLGDFPLERLLQEVRSVRTGLPLIAAGGIARESDFARLRANGADGCLCGTLFAATEESDAHPHLKARILAGAAQDTVITDLFDIGWPNRPHRVLRNEIVAKGRALPAAFIGKTTLFGKFYPIPRFSAAVPTIRTEGDIEQMAMYCGTSCEHISAIRPAAEVVAHFRRSHGAAPSLQAAE